MKKSSNNFAFIDSQNLNLSIQSLGWKLDFKKFRIHLAERYGVTKAYLFIGYIEENKSLYTFLQQVGYILVFKPTLEGEKGVVKGNCDAELVLHCMIQYPHFDKAVIVSGDGDFYCLIEYLQQKDKFLKLGIPNQRRYSALLRKFRPQFFYISDLRSRLLYVNKKSTSKKSPRRAFNRTESG